MKIVTTCIFQCDNEEEYSEALAAILEFLEIAIINIKRTYNRIK